jgi:predicted kinase
MATAYLMVGFAGAGKTTYAKELALRRRAVRFTPDEWVDQIFPEALSHKEFDACFGRFCQLVWSVASQCLRNGQDVILDIGFWSRDSREHARRKVAEIGCTCEVIFVDCDESLICERLLSRSGSFWTSEGFIRDKLASFERPQPDELHAVVRGGQ